MTITTRIYTAFCGKLVGQDQFGNRYYAQRSARPDMTSARKRGKRWVIYKGMAEPSKVPPEWHGWLHYTLDAPPTERHIAHHSWEAPPIPNLTGTPGAYLPPGHLNKGAQRDPSTSDYEAWKP